MIPTNEQPTARDYASACLAWHLDAPSASAFLVGSTLIDAIPGLGITARIDGRFIAIGVVPLFASLDIPLSPAIRKPIAQTHLAGQQTILIGNWKGIECICAIARPKPVRRAAWALSTRRR
jgi:cation transport ATPase